MSDSVETFSSLPLGAKEPVIQDDLDHQNYVSQGLVKFEPEAEKQITPDETADAGVLLLAVHKYIHPSDIIVPSTHFETPDPADEYLPAHVLQPNRKTSLRRIQRILATGAILLSGVAVGTEAQIHDHTFSILSTRATLAIKKYINSTRVSALPPTPANTRITTEGTIPTNGVGATTTTTTEPTPTTTTVPSVEVPATAAVASTSFINTDPLFASKPSFLQNFTTMANGSISNNIWNTEVGNGVNGWGNEEDEYYTTNPNNVRVQNGSLVIQANKETIDGHEYTSARIDTEGKENFEYGKIDIVAKVPDGVGAWPSFWMVSANNTYEDLEPPSDLQRYRNNGEIDIMESIGAQPGYIYGIPHSRVEQGSAKTYVPNTATTYNTYSLEWTPTSMVFLVNGKPFFTDTKKAGASYKEWPFDQPFYLIIDQAIGGAWGGTDKNLYPPNGVNNKIFPSVMQIESIAYYPYDGPKPTQAELNQIKSGN